MASLQTLISVYGLLSEAGEIDFAVRLGWTRKVAQEYLASFAKEHTESTYRESSLAPCQATASLHQAQPSQLSTGLVTLA